MSIDSLLDIIRNAVTNKHHYHPQKTKVYPANGLTNCFCLFHI